MDVVLLFCHTHSNATLHLYCHVFNTGFKQKKIIEEKSQMYVVCSNLKPLCLMLLIIKIGGMLAPYLSSDPNDDLW